jgi:hypothetical protein
MMLISALITSLHKKLCGETSDQDDLDQLRTIMRLR